MAANEGGLEEPLREGQAGPKRPAPLLLRRQNLYLIAADPMRCMTETATGLDQVQAVLLPGNVGRALARIAQKHRCSEACRAKIQSSCTDRGHPGLCDLLLVGSSRILERVFPEVLPAFDRLFLCVSGMKAAESSRGRVA